MLWNKLTLEERKLDLIKMSETIHIDDNGCTLYLYDKFIYKNYATKSDIYCLIHNCYFQKSMSKHISSKQGCPKCSRELQSKLTMMGKDEFIKRAQDVHKNLDGTPIYDYSLVIYINEDTPVRIICPIRGVIEQSPNNHLRKVSYYKFKTHKTEQFILKAILVHGNKYDYSKVVYVNNKSMIIIICNACGNEFTQMAAKHLIGKGNACAPCRYNDKKLTNEEFIQKSQLIHMDENGDPLYDYSLCKYMNYFTEVTIICKKCGNQFIQRAVKHLGGSCGCGDCLKKTVMQRKLFHLLKKTFNQCEIQSEKRLNWLYRQSLDIYFAEYNIAIEYQGIQHFKPIKNWGGENKFKIVREMDVRKNKLCSENNCELLYFTYKPDEISSDYPYNVYIDEKKLIAEIKRLIKIVQ